jgi:2-dehydropantoate 2-reductase
VRYLVIGAGGVGATIGAQLFLAGRDAVLVARGEHLAALRAHGLRYSQPTGTQTLPIPAVAGPDELELTGDDVLVLATKSQDTAAALEPWAGRPLAGGWSDELPVVCAQNGVDNERSALRRFGSVYGMAVMLPASHLAPGEVTAASHPTVGILPVGRYPDGVDATAEAIGADLTAARFAAPVVPDVMRYKHTKLLSNLNNAIEALCGWGVHDEDIRRLSERAGAEARAVYREHGIQTLTDAEEAEVRAPMNIQEVAGAPRAGGSTWQSLHRGTGRVEADFLNGEIALLARLHGGDAPVNALLQRLADRAAATGRKPGETTAADILALLPPG